MPYSIEVRSVVNIDGKDDFQDATTKCIIVKSDQVEEWASLIFTAGHKSCRLIDLIKWCSCSNAACSAKVCRHGVHRLESTRSEA